MCAADGRIAINVEQTACNQGELATSGVSSDRGCNSSTAHRSSHTASLLQSSAVHQGPQEQSPVLEVNEVLQQPLACALHLADDQPQALSFRQAAVVIVEWIRDVLLSEGCCHRSR